MIGDVDELARQVVVRHRSRSGNERARQHTIAPRLRRLTEEEIALWTEVVRSVSRRRGASLPTPSKPVAAKLAQPPPPSAHASELRPKPRALPLAPIERRLKRELGRGRGAIDGALDLHGMTQAEAHEALRGFLRHSQARGAKLVIVVTGKGGLLDDLAPFGQERGVLRRLTPIGCAKPTCVQSSWGLRRPAAPTAGQGRSM